MSFHQLGLAIILLVFGEVEQNGCMLAECELTRSVIVWKVVHFVRHGNGYHNLPYMFDMEDPRLTPLGWQQAEQLRIEFGKMAKPPKIQVCEKMTIQ